MMMARMKFAREGGNTLVIVMLMLLALSAVGAALLSIALVEVDISGNQRSGEMALYNADAGLRAALPGVLPGLKTGETQLTNIASTVLPEKAVNNGVGDLADSSFAVEGEMAFDSKNNHVKCQLEGQEHHRGRRMFLFESTGYVYPPGTGMGDPRRAYAARGVEAIVMTPPEDNVCPPGLGGQY